MTGDNARTWLLFLSSPENAAATLVCFPHAGGSASAFGDWGRLFPALKTVAVKYPGRADRYSEACPTSITNLSQAIANALIELKPNPLILFGHSMGAIVAFETARAIDTLHTSVCHLFVSGSCDCATLPAGNLLGAPAEQTDEELVEDLRALGGVPEDLLGNADFLELVLPYVHSDGKMFRNYQMKEEPLLDCPITAIVGDADDRADKRPWSKLTTSRFDQRYLPGGHFYLNDCPPVGIVSAVCLPVAS